MIDPTQGLSPADSQFDALLADYVAAEESETPPDREEWLARYPEHAADLREFFANRDQMQRLARPLQVGNGRANGHPLGKIRYFGDYELLEEIAAGGMGVVYKARQVSLNRVVAVKMILRGSLASEEDIKRFRAEAEAAASLQHAGIVPIHEVGLHDGQHYFSMDFIEGKNLAELLRDNPLSAKQAATYVSAAAEAVHYAHKQGTLHRDLKPSNLLIDKQDRVRITDFGLAKRIEGNSDLTLSGQILGTPSYMPPEQATGKRSLIAAPSDVYSLGAILYELLAGRPPFRGETPTETLRQVETLEPFSPRLLNPAVPRDLETICLKCLRKEPHKRYGTAQLLVDDLQRFLQGQPILARPLGSIERTWRRCRQYPVVTALIATVALSLVLGTSVSAYFAIEANIRAVSETKLRELADQERRIAKAHEDLAVDAQGKSAESLKDALAAVEQMLTRVSQERLANVPQMEPVRKELMEEALKFYQKFLKENHDDPLIRRETAGAYRRMADIYRRLGRHVEAEECYLKAFEMFGELETQSALEPSIRNDLSAAHFEVATCYCYLDRPSEGERHFRLAVEFAEQLTNEFNNPEYVEQWVVAATLLSHAIGATQPDEAESILRRNLTLAKSPHSLERCHSVFGIHLVNQGRNSEAVPLFRKAIKYCELIIAEDPTSNWRQSSLADNLSWLGTVLTGLGELEEAESVLERAVNLYDKLAADFPFGPDNHTGQAWAHHNQALLLGKLNRKEAAEQATRESLELFKLLAAKFPSTSNFAVTAINQVLNHGSHLEESGRTDEALQVYREAFALAEKRIDEKSPRLDQWHGLVQAQVAIGRLLGQRGDVSASEAAFRRAVEIQLALESAFRNRTTVRRDLAQCHLRAAESFNSASRWRDAETILRLAIEKYAALATDGPKEPLCQQNLANCHQQLATALAGQNQISEVTTALELSIAARRKLAANFPKSREHRYELAEALFRLANWARSRHPKAAESACREALALMRRLSAEFPDMFIYSRQTTHFCVDLASLLLEAGRLDEAETLAREAVAWGANMAKDTTADAETRNTVGMAYRILASVMRGKRRTPEAEQAFRAARDIFARLAADLPGQARYREYLAQTQYDWEGVLSSAGQAEKSLENYELCAATWRKLAKEFPASHVYRHELANICSVIGRKLHYTSRQKDAELAYREALTVTDQLLSMRPDAVSYAIQAGEIRTSLATLLRETGRLDESEQLVRQIFQLTDEMGTNTGAEPNVRLLSGKAQRLLGTCSRGENSTRKRNWPSARRRKS